MFNFAKLTEANKKVLGAIGGFLGRLRKCLVLLWPVFNLLVILAGGLFLHQENQKYHLDFKNTLGVIGSNSTIQREKALDDINTKLNTLLAAPKCTTEQNKNIATAPNTLILQQAAQWQIIKILNEALEDLTSARNIAAKLHKLRAFDNQYINNTLDEVDKIELDALLPNHKLMERLLRIYNQLDELYKNPHHSEKVGIIGWLQNKLSRLVKVSSLHEENILLAQKQSVILAIQSVKANDVQAAYDALKDEKINVLEYAQLMPALEQKAKLRIALEKMINEILQSE